MRKQLLTLLAVVLTTTTLAQAQDKPEANINADIASQYIWRGMELGRASILPSIELGWKGLFFTADGAIGITSDAAERELNLTLGYSISGLSFGITDYWSGTGDDKYIYRRHTRHNHVIEGFVGYDFGIFSASWQTMFAGRDGYNKNSKRAYSSYVELKCPFRFATCDWEAEVGVVPYATTYYETKGFGVTNVTLRATKVLPITDRFSLPLFAQLTANPYNRYGYMVFGITLSTGK